jgi:DNA-binding response OmpR family regulator
MRRKVLIIEDDIDLNYTISKYLNLKGFETCSIFDPDVALEKIYENNFDLLILDIKLPKINGFDLLKKIRSFSTIPVIFLTSLNSQNDIEKGFLLGGDDYITKPFSLKELFLRVEAIYRRVYGNHEIVKLGEKLYFDTRNKTLIENGNIIELKRKEAQLLDLFLKNKNKLLTKEFILENIYRFEETPKEASLRTFIYNLRKKLPRGSIKTQKDLGYIYVGLEKNSL